MSKRKLLLADNTLTIQKLINLTFADEGFDVFTVGSGTAVINRIMDLEPDIVLADVQMPGLNGYEVCEKIRGIEQFQNLPVILLVGAGENYDETEARRVGANDFLIKQPFQSTRQVVEKVVAILAAADSRSSNAVSITSATATDATDYKPESLVQAGAENASDDFQATVAPDEVRALSESANDAPVEGAATFEETEAVPPLADPENPFGDGSADDETIETSAGSDFVGAAENLNSTGEKMNRTNSETTESNFKVVDDSATNQTDVNSAEAATLEIDETIFATNAFGEVQTNGFDLNAEEFELQLPTIEADVITSEPSAVEVIEFAEMPALNVQLEPEELSFAPPPAAAESTAEVVPEPTFETVGGASDIPANNSLNPNAATEFSPTFRENSAPTDNSAAFEIDLDDDDSLLEIGDNFKSDALAETETPILDAVIQARSVNLPSQTIASETNTTPLVVQNQSENQQSQHFGATAFDNLNFPPELIEAIANKVVEKLSDKVIERIAWEVVPERFDLIINKHIDKRER